jgi:biopolymer transport protein ExbD
MTSMIDATFLLLAYFIFTTGVERREEQLAAALAARAAATATELRPQVIEVRGGTDTAFTVGSNAVATRDELRAILERLPKEAGLLVRGHDSASVASVAAAMQAASDAGFGEVAYASAR